MGSIPPGGWGTGPRRDRWGQPFDDEERRHTPHYGLWGVALGSLLASLLVARSQGRSMREVLLRVALICIGLYALVVVLIILHSAAITVVGLVPGGSHTVAAVVAALLVAWTARRGYIFGHGRLVLYGLLALWIVAWLLNGERGRSGLFQAGPCH